MGNCIFCGKPAGFLRRRHRECQDKYNRTWQAMLNRAKEAALGLGQLDDLNQQLSVLAQKGYVPQSKVNEVLMLGWEEAVSHFLEDGNLDAEEEKSLSEYVEFFGLTQDELDKKRAYTRFIKGAVLREIMEGKVPQRFKLSTPLPLNFQKSEEFGMGIFRC